MRVLIVSEGENELGKAEFAGALEGFLRRLRGDIHVCESITVRHPDLGKLHGKGPRFLKRAVRAMEYAGKEGFDAVVMVIDDDGDRDRRTQFTQAQDYVVFGIRRAFGVAVRSFDAWMLADEVALSDVLGSTIQAQPDPEAERDPKGCCQRLIDGSGKGAGLTEFYLQLAERIRLEVLKRRCSSGFGVFAERVEKM